MNNCDLCLTDVFENGEVINLIVLICHPFSRQSVIDGQLFFNLILRFLQRIKSTVRQLQPFQFCIIMKSALFRIRDRLPRSAREEMPREASQEIILRITNKDCRYRLKYGCEFKDMLEARDQVLEHEFDFEFDLATLERGEQSLIHSLLFKDILASIQDFLLQVLSNVTSAAFKLLCKGELNESQAKEYASKNMMVNMRGIFLKTVTAVKGNSLIAERFDSDQLQQFKQQLAIDLDYIASNVLLNLADNYPQAPAAGGTVRMRDAILDIKRVQQQANDLIFASKIKIQDFIDQETNQNPHETPEYTKFIMKVINTAINTVSSIEGDYKERSLFEKFTEFCNTLFSIIHQEDYRSFIALYENKPEQPSKQSKSQELYKRQQTQRQTVRNSIVNHFSLLLQGSKEKAEEAINKIEKGPLGQSLQKQQYQAYPLLQLQARFQKMVKNADSGLQDLKKSHKYAMGQKIPAYVKEFTRQEIQGKEFRADHSSVLRVMTKWAQSLRQMFDNPMQIVYKRLYPFKTTTNQLVHVLNENNGVEKLINQLRKEGQAVQRQQKLLLQSCYKLISDILSEDSKLQGNVRRYSDCRSVASKINAVLSFLMLKYLNLLIQHFIQAGTCIWTDKGWQDINLIVFRVSDLLRSKLQCTETQFINLLKTMYVLDDSEEMTGKFKLVRIKNKLDDPANNIIINYLFMGRVQCELQLSIQEPKGKEKNYYTFSHFVYELTRGRFGTIAQCAIMISQLDPMVIASKGTYYTQKKAEAAQLKTSLCLERQSKMQEEQMLNNSQQWSKVQEKSEQIKKNDAQKETNNFKDTIFHCSKCQRFVVNESTSIFIKKKGSVVCNKCMSKSTNCEKFFKNQQLRKAFIDNQPNKCCLHRAYSYSDVKKEVESTKDKYLSIAKVNQRGKLDIHLVTYIEEQLRTIVVRIDSNILSNYSKGQLDFSSLDSIDIAKLIKKEKKRPSQNLIYFTKVYLL